MPNPSEAEKQNILATLKSQIGTSGMPATGTYSVGFIGEPHLGNRHPYGPDLWEVTIRDGKVDPNPIKRPFGSY